MKTMTCKQMGGPCDVEIHGSSADEMMGNGMTHMEKDHPEMAADIKAMPKDDPAMTAWYDKFMKDYAALPENK